jgi:hypothetical protein
MVVGGSRGVYQGDDVAAHRDRLSNSSRHVDSLGECLRGASISFSEQLRAIHLRERGYRLDAGLRGRLRSRTEALEARLQKAPWPRFHFLRLRVVRRGVGASVVVELARTRPMR